MIETERFARLEVRSAAELRAWLSANHAQKESVWLVTYKKHTGGAYVSKAEVLDELLCFGWVDGLARKLDADRTMQLISRRRMHAWAQTYRDRAARLEREGRMQPPGLAAIDHAKALGLWMATAGVDALVVPPDLLAALEARSAAQANFEGFVPSYRRNVLRWIAATKQAATRAGRVEKTATLAALGQKVPQL